jgi:hypothetical protein
MLRPAPLLLALVIAGCAPTPVPQPASQPSIPISSRTPGTLIGLTASDMTQRFGRPVLQVREGQSLKLQFRGPRCVLDAYLYPPAGGGAERVTHVDTRLPTGSDTDQAGCIAALRPS